jgi:hypothetical protein
VVINVSELQPEKPDMSEAPVTFTPDMIAAHSNDLEYLESLRAKAARTTLSLAEARALNVLEDIHTGALS